MNWQWGGKRIGALAAMAVVVVTIGASTGSAFGENKNAESAAMRMRQIEDRQAIEQLLVGDYPRALDSANWKAYSALFAQDGTLIMQGGAIKGTGPAAIEEFFTKMPAFGGEAASATPSPCPVPAGTPRTKHAVTNLSVHIDGDTATDQAYWQTIATKIASPSSPAPGITRTR